MRAANDGGRGSSWVAVVRALADAQREEVNRDGLRVLTVILGRAPSSDRESLQRMHGPRGSDA